MTQPPRLLVSVRSAEEAREALVGGCEILDVKEPANGPLGMARHSVIAEIATCVRETATHVPLSAALGELRDWNSHGPFRPLPADLAFAKLGLAGMKGRADWREMWQRVRHRIDQRGRSKLCWVAVAYADHELADAPSPADVVAAARETCCRILLIDTFTKDGRTLLDFQSPSALEAIAAAAHEAGLQLALAGNLRAELLPGLDHLVPDLLAIRSAACRDGARSAAVCASAVAQFRRALRATWRESARPSLA